MTRKARLLFTASAKVRIAKFCLNSRISPKWDLQDSAHKTCTLAFVVLHIGHVCAELRARLAGFLWRKLPRLEQLTKMTGVCRVESLPLNRYEIHFPVVNSSGFIWTLTESSWKY